MQYLKSMMHLLAGTVTSFGKTRSLVWQMASREVSSKYRGSFLGAMWTVLTPLLMLAVYTLVFGVIFKTRWAGGSGSKVEFATLMFSGMVVFNLFSEVVNRAPRLILDNTNFVKKVVFPLEALPWVALISALLIPLLAWLYCLCLL